MMVTTLLTIYSLSLFTPSGGAHTVAGSCTALMMLSRRDPRRRRQPRIEQSYPLAN